MGVLRITADENIPQVVEAFSRLGRVEAVAGRALHRGQLLDCDILLVRSVSRVDSSLLQGTPVRFVASATIGVDHVDCDYLRSAGIGFANSPGCNADAAAQYVLACTSAWALQQGRDLADLRVGIVGCGQVGSRVERLFDACGARCLVNDPPRAAREGNAGFVSIEAVCECDVVSLHVPLTVDGAHPSRHLFDARRLSQLRAGCLLVNAARGAVIDNPALLHRLGRGDLQAILDTWEGEPWIDRTLVEACFLGTPHIAGYSLEGRLRGTEMIYKAVCRFLGEAPCWSAAAQLPPVTRGLVLGPESNPSTALARLVLDSYDPRRDDAQLRSALQSPAGIGPEFDRLRRGYPLRREFDAYRVGVDTSAAELGERVRRLGFQTANC